MVRDQILILPWDGQAWCGPFAALVERAAMVGQFRVFPTGFGVADKQQGFQDIHRV
jgi:hypothetical protein